MKDAGLNKAALCCQIKLQYFEISLLMPDKMYHHTSVIITTDKISVVFSPSSSSKKNLAQLPIISSSFFSPISCFPATDWFVFYPFDLPLDFFSSVFCLCPEWKLVLMAVLAYCPSFSLQLLFPLPSWASHTIYQSKTRTWGKNCLEAGHTSSIWDSSVSLG